MEEEEKVQYKAALIVSGAWKGSNRAKLYEELGWESLSDRRRCRRLLYLYKIVANKTPSYLKDILSLRRINNNEEAPPMFNNPARYNATERYKSTFFPDAINNWNILLSDFTSMPSLLSFKSHLNTFFDQEKNLCIKFVIV